jgi:hypothetical protein
MRERDACGIRGSFNCWKKIKYTLLHLMNQGHETLDMLSISKGH